jgi:hypothetical protein
MTIKAFFGVDSEIGLFLFIGCIYSRSEKTKYKLF